MFRQRTKLAHRVTGASSPSVATSVGGGGGQTWQSGDQSRATPPLSQPQFYNPNSVGLPPTQSPGPPQQQQVWQQPAPPNQQYNTGQQWYNPQQPTSLPSNNTAVKPAPPSQNNNNTYANNDPWSWGSQQQWEEQQWQTSQQQPTSFPGQYQQQPQQQQQQAPINNQQQYQPGYQSQQLHQQPAGMNNQQYQQPGYQQQQTQNDAWNWSSWNTTSQDSAWNWGTDDSSPSTENSNGATQNTTEYPQQSTTEYQQQNTTEYQQQNYTHEQYEQYQNYQQQELASQQNNYQVQNSFTSTQQANEINTVSQQLAEVSLQENVTENQPVETQHVDISGQNSIDYSLNRRESNLSVDSKGRASTEYSENQRESVDVTGHDSITYSDTPRESITSVDRVDEWGPESMSMIITDSQRGSTVDSFDPQGHEAALLTENPESSVDASRRESTNNLPNTPDLSSTEINSQQLHQQEINNSIDLTHTNVDLTNNYISGVANQELNTDTPDLVTDFENREIVPPESLMRASYGGHKSRSSSGEKMPPIIPASSTLVAAVSANLETVPDNIERPEDAVPLQPSTPPPPPPPVSQGHRVGVGQDDPQPWPSTIPPPENQEVTSSKSLPPPPLRPQHSSRHRPTHSNSPPLPPPPPLSSTPASLDPVSASDRNQFLETGQLSADITMFGRRQTIPGESRQSPEPGGLRVVPGTTEPDEPSPDLQRSETIGSDFGEAPNPRSSMLASNEVRTNAEGFNNEPQNRPVGIGADNLRTRTNAEGEPIPTQAYPPLPRTVTVGNDNTELRTNAEGTNTERSIPVTQVRTNAEGINNSLIQSPIPRPGDTRMNAEGINNPVIQAPIPRPGDTRTNAEGTNEDLRRSRNTAQPISTPPPRVSAIGVSSSQERSSAFTEVRNTTPVAPQARNSVEGSRTTTTQSRSSAEGVNSQRSNVTSLRSSAEGDNPSLGSDMDDGEISDLENISSGEIEKEDGELDESVEERKEEKKKSPLQARAPSADSGELRPSSAGRRDRGSRKERGGSEERKSAERARGKPPRSQDDSRRRERDRESQPRSRRHRYDDDDSDSYHSERGGHGDRDDRRRYKDSRNKSPDRRHKSSRRPHDYYRDRDEYGRHRDHREHRHGYDRVHHHYDRERSRPSSRAGSEVRRDYESDQQERASASGRSHRDTHRGPRDKPPSGQQYYDRYGSYRRGDPRDPYYRGGYDDYYRRAPYDTHYATTPRAPPAAQPPMQHPEYNSYTFAYFEELRRSNPAAYAEWYRRYFAASAAVSSQAGPGSGTFDGFPEDEHNSRGSVHSGRSSINDEISAVNALGDRSATSPAIVQRLTPAKFTSAHTVARLTVQGRVVHVLPNYPRDGQVAAVLLHDMSSLLAHDPVQAELRAFPGPLVKGTTHKNSVIQFCSQKIRSAQQNTQMYDRDSYILVWRLLILLLKQNGTVVGADIADLLLEDQSDAKSLVGDDYDNRSPSPRSSEDHLDKEPPSSLQSHHHHHRMSEEQLTHKFRQYLLFGNTKDALDWAMKHGLWGHALFLASKMDARTYANVMTRFANGLPLNDPLQTLYQLMSGRQPAAVTSCADEKWGDWKPHLAMILSNPSQRPELDHRAITTLGDTLATRGCLHASHFCYLLAQLEFGSYEQQPPAKLVLLGSSHLSLPFVAFSSNEAIQCTEVYEYARRLADPSFYLPHFQSYKFIYAARLVEYGCAVEGLAYCEEIAGTLIQHAGSGQVNMVLADQLTNLADSLKQIDPLFTPVEPSTQEDGAAFYASDPAWLTQLRQLLGNPMQPSSMPESPAHGVVETGYSSVDYTNNVSMGDVNAQESLSYNEQWSQYYYEQQMWQQQQQQQQQSAQQTPESAAPSTGNEASDATSDQSQQQQQQTQANSGYWPQQQQQQWSAPDVSASNQGESNEATQQSNTTTVEPPVSGTPTFSPEHQPSYWDKQYQQQNNLTESEHPAPTITLAGSRPRQKTLSESSSSSTANHKQASKPASTKPAQPLNTGDGGGWLGGLFSKFSLKPKNQMKLPDDKNPTIVWDPDRKRWVNTDADEDDAASELRPPPKAMSNHSAPLAPVSQSQPENAPQATLQAPPASGAGYKLGRGMKKNYVNVLQPNGTASSNKVAPPADIFPGMAPQPSGPVNFFVPAPVAEGEAGMQTEFTTPASSAPESPQSNTDSSDHAASQQAASFPMMYNPAQFTPSQNNFAYQR